MLKKIFDKFHILQNIYLKNKHFIKKRSYSMDGEDLEIVKYFENLDNGFYVDVGCYHPIEMNNTYLLYKKNWKGINIDVSKFSIDLEPRIEFIKSFFSNGQKQIFDFSGLNESLNFTRLVNLRINLI